MLVAINSIYTWLSTWLSTIFNLTLPTGQGTSMQLLVIFYFIFAVRLLAKVIKYIITNSDFSALDKRNYKDE